MHADELIAGVPIVFPRTIWANLRDQVASLVVAISRLALAEKLVNRIVFGWNIVPRRAVVGQVVREFFHAAAVGIDCNQPILAVVLASRAAELGIPNGNEV